MQRASNMKFLLDSGDPDEYREIAKIAKAAGHELWGSTTNPSLVAKKLAGKKLTLDQTFSLQKELVMEIVTIVPGAVSAEVYADEKTTAEEMIAQGMEIATWHRRVVVKLPTTVEGFKARTALRKKKIPVNNTLVFSQEQVFAICLHELIIQKQYGPTDDLYPPFISPFVGRLDDTGLDGMTLIENSMKIKKKFAMPMPMTGLAIWMLEASVRSVNHIMRGMAAQSELITAPAKIYQEFFTKKRTAGGGKSDQTVQPIPYWDPQEDLFLIDTADRFQHAIETKELNIQHDLTDKGIRRFAEDWQAILA